MTILEFGQIIRLSPLALAAVRGDMHMKIGENRWTLKCQYRDNLLDCEKANRYCNA